jgi:DNA-3-methyladenine glycosylase
LGAWLSHTTAEGTVVLRITEVEAYLGDLDPGSHAYRGRTPRNAVMFGEAGFVYTYFTYGMHVCVNLVCSPVGEASAVLLRGAEVVEGVELARGRRGPTVADRDLARGPARLVVASGIRLDENGSDLFAAPFHLEPPKRQAQFEVGPRTGLRLAADFPWRFWIPGDPTVSPYKPHVAKRRGPDS